MRPETFDLTRTKAILLYFCISVLFFTPYAMYTVNRRNKELTTELQTLKAADRARAIAHDKCGEALIACKADLQWCRVK